MTDPEIDTKGLTFSHGENIVEQVNFQNLNLIFFFSWSGAKEIIVSPTTVAICKPKGMKLDIVQVPF